MKTFQTWLGITRALWLLIILLGGVASDAQTTASRKSPPLVEAPPASAGMSAERLARIDVMCQEAIRDGVIPGVVVLVARHGKIVYHRAFGYADYGTKRLLRTDDIFRIASQTKAITATAVMMLWEEGHFQLDDPISKFIPEFKNPKVLKTFRYAETNYTAEPARSEVTIRHLLTHTSGIGYGIIDSDERFKMLYAKAGITDLFTTEPVCLADNVRLLAKLPLHHHPGERFTYSESLDVLGYLVEVISKQPFDVFLRRHIFGPLRMDDTWFYVPEEKAPRLVPVQHPLGDGWARYPVTFYDPDYPIKGARTFFSGGAGLCSTARDYATFLQMYLNGGELEGKRILSRTTVKTILSNQTGDLMTGSPNGDRYYGLAFGVLAEAGQAKGGLGSAGTFEWGGYFSTQFFADPQEKLIGVIMKQTQGTLADDTSERFRRLALQAVDD